MSRRRVEHTVENIEQGRFTRSVLSKQGMHFSLSYRKRNIGQGHNTRELFSHIFKTNVFVVHTVSLPKSVSFSTIGQPHTGKIYDCPTF